MKAYQIRAGERFVMPDGSTLEGGSVIELPDDLAELHAARLDAIASEIEQKPKHVDEI